MGRKQKCCHEIKWSLQMKWQHFAQQSKHAELHHQQKLIWNLKMFPWKGNHLHIINFGVPCYFAGGSMTTLSWMEVSRCESFCWTRQKITASFLHLLHHHAGTHHLGSTTVVDRSPTSPPPSWRWYQHLPSTNPRGCIFPVPKIIKSIATQ